MWKGEVQEGSGVRAGGRGRGSGRQRETINPSVARVLAQKARALIPPAGEAVLHQLRLPRCGGNRLPASAPRDPQPDRPDHGLQGHAGLLPGLARRRRLAAGLQTLLQVSSCEMGVMDEWGS